MYAWRRNSCFKQLVRLIWLPSSAALVRQAAYGAFHQFLPAALSLAKFSKGESWGSASRLSWISTSHNLRCRSSASFFRLLIFSSLCFGKLMAVSVVSIEWLEFADVESLPKMALLSSTNMFSTSLDHSFPCHT